jgi:hypothetical protein
MKKIYLTVAVLLSAVQLSHAQWTYNSTNTAINTTNKVGIAPLASGVGSALVVVGAVEVGGGFNADPGTNGAFWLGGAYDYATNLAGLNLSFNTGANNARMMRMYINSLGNVGIGTTNPASLLDVNGTFRGIADNTYLGFDAGTDRFGIVKKYGFYGQLAYGSTATFTISQSNGTTIDASNTFTPRLTIDNSGNVGIGTTAPDTKFTVNGTIHAKEVKVDMNILPDYVFKPGYDLLTLDEVKRYIDKNQHLPGVPSAEQTEKEGLKLGEMNAVLLKKVEELTLYLIEENKQNKLQQEQINKLRQQLNTAIKALTKN